MVMERFRQKSTVAAKFSGVIFSLFWLGISGTIAVFFGQGIFKEVQTGASPWMFLILLFPLCFILIGLWILYVSLKVDEEKQIPGISSSSQKTKSKTEFEKSTSIGAFLFGLPFFLAGVGVMVFFSIAPTIRTLMSYQWHEVSARIISSNVKTNSSSDGNSYKIQVQFEYTYGDHRYVSDTYDFQTFSSNSYRSARKKVNAAPSGSIQTAYVNPNKPSEAILSRRLSRVYLFTFLFGGIFAAIGGAIIFGTLKGAPKGNITRQTIPQRKTTLGPTILKPKSGGPLLRFIGIFVFTSTWSGIIYLIMVKKAPTLFLVVFGFFGVVMIFATLHSLLALFNPRPQLEVDTTQVALGRSLQLNWRIKGNVNRIENLSIKLIGQEEATYRRGTNTYTDRNIFYEDVITDYPSVVNMGAGNNIVEVPKETIHSWNSTNNKIIWMLTVNGKIAEWPDIKEEYIITVLPL